MILENLKGLRCKLITLSVVLILLTAVPMGLIFNTTMQRVFLQTYIATSTEQLKTINEMAELFQQSIDNDIRMFATDPLILQADTTITTYLENTDETKLMTPSKNGGIEQEIYRAFERYAQTHPGTLFVNMGTVTGGYIQWPETTNTPHYDPRIRPWYTQAIEGGDGVSRSAPYADTITGTLLVSDVMPIKNAEGKLIGVMDIDVSSDKMAGILKEVSIGETGYCMMIHKSGLVIADPSNPENNTKYVKDIGIAGLEKVLNGRQNQFEVQIQGVMYFVNSLRMNESDWIIVSLITTHELYKTSTEIKQLILAVCSVALLIGLVLTFIGSGKIVEPIVGVSNLAQNIANGNLLVEFKKKGTTDEIGVLENSMSRMVSQLQKMMGELESKNSLLAKEIADREQAQATLAISEEKYSKAFHYATDVICLVKFSTGKFVEVSEAFFTVFGYTRAEVIGHTTIELALWGIEEERWTIYRVLHAGQLVRNHEAHWRTKEGQERLGLCSVEEIDINNEPHLLAVWHDITEAKQAEVALLKAKDELEIKVEMRTQELMAANEELLSLNESLVNTLQELQQMQEQLIQSGKMASLGMLVAGVAHEINTPVGVSVTAASYLAGLSSNITRMYQEGVLAREDLENYLLETEQSVSILTANLARAAHLINSFKNVSVDQSSERKRLFIVAAYLEEIILTLHPKFKKTNIEIVIDGDEKLEIYGHAGAFAQIITNLLDNSLIHAYDKKDRGCISIHFHAVDGNFHLHYTDDGKGMSVDSVAHIFEPFFTTKRSEGGTGLGMHIVYNIVSVTFGGTIECSSSLGTGANFTIVFPLQQERGHKKARVEGDKGGEHSEHS